MTGSTIEHTRDLVHFGDDSFAYAGHHQHPVAHPVHTHSFVEVAIVYSGEGVHHSLAGRQRITPGNVVLLRPGVWHGYEDCRDLDVYNCCFSTELLRRELAWTRDNPLLGNLLWTSPYASGRRGMLSTRLTDPVFAECLGHLDALNTLRMQPSALFRSDMIARLTMVLGCVARQVADGLPPERLHPVVAEAMRLLEDRPAHGWTLTELAGLLHHTPGYLVRLFKTATGLPPMAYLCRHRVELAAEQLVYTDRPIHAIAESVGRPDQNYFARRFQAHLGLNASAYRARFRANSMRLNPAGVPSSI